MNVQSEPYKISKMRNNIVQRCDFRLHDMIDGKYRVERVMGENQSQRKFKVIDSQGREYILTLLKLWEVEPRMQKLMCARSESEIKSCQIKSNYLTRIMQTGVVKGNPYLLTEFCNSTDLSHWIRNPRLDLVKTLKDILYGLRDLHRSGKVHCRLTPENILITEDKKVLITNYVVLGERNKIATDKGSMRSRAVNKAMAYMAPEFYRTENGATVLPSVDLFSFGVVLYQMLTAELPFGKLMTESDWIHYQSRAATEDWNRNILPRDSNRDKWISILEKCLAASAYNRAKDVDEILAMMPDALDNYVAMDGSQVECPATILNGVLLRVMQGEEFGRCYRLSEIMQRPKRIITIGREDETVFNMMQIKEGATAFISRRHCTVEWDSDSDKWYIRDGQWDKESKDWSRSLNGTYLNSEEVADDGRMIESGDIISVGDVKLRVEGY